MKYFFHHTIYFYSYSKDYIGPFKLKDWLYLPIAYVRFMYFSYRVPAILFFRRLRIK